MIPQERLLGDVVTWAGSDENIRLVVLTGSLARGEGRDSLSDVDLELYVRDNRSFLRSGHWYRQFGYVLVVEALSNPGWHPTRLVYYVGGKVDFMIAKDSVLDEGVTYTSPYRVLVDKDDRGQRLSSDPAAATQPPTARDYQRCCEWFYAAALMCARCVVRRDPWAAKYRDWDLKRNLLEMIVWDHKSRYGWQYDTRFHGGHLREWLDPDLVPALDACWGTFSEESTRAALVSSMDLFDGLSDRTAIRLHLPPFDSSLVRNEVARILQLS